uniref:Uncharacterized protein n=1 Tax=Arundo donax TaxID=35708 RepID=A0A0A9CK24_ARUDO
MTCSSAEAYIVAGTQLFLPTRTFPYVRLAPDCKLDKYACKRRGFCNGSDSFLRLLGSLDSRPCNDGRLGKKSERERFLGAPSEPAVVSFPNPPAVVEGPTN